MIKMKWVTLPQLRKMLSWNLYWEWVSHTGHINLCHEKRRVMITIRHDVNFYEKLTTLLHEFGHLIIYLLFPLSCNVGFIHII